MDADQQTDRLKDLERVEDLPSSSSRRDFMKKGAIAGALAWAAPSIASLPGSRVLAGHTTPCPCTDCRASACSVLALGDCLTPDLVGCISADVDTGSGSVPRVRVNANVACQRADDATCSAQALVEGARIRIGEDPGAIDISVESAASCVHCGTGDSQAEDITVNGDPIEIPEGCNQTLDLGVAQLAFNVQECVDGTLTTEALRITALGAEAVVLARSSAGASGCACTACSDNPTCSLPTEDDF